MEMFDDYDDLKRYRRGAVEVSNDSPVLLDRFLNNAIEVDVDALADGKDVVIGGIMEHNEEAGVHSGDSACSLPAHSLPKKVQDDIRTQIVKLAKALKVVGLMNTQFAVQDGKVYLLAVNPRASRTRPFVSTGTGRPLPQRATRAQAGHVGGGRGGRER